MDYNLAFWNMNAVDKIKYYADYLCDECDQGGGCAEKIKPDFTTRYCDTQLMLRSINTNIDDLLTEIKG